MSRGRPNSGHARLIGLVLVSAGQMGRLISHNERPWASATFTGVLHRLCLAFCGAEACAEGEAFVTALPEQPFDLPGCLVADASIASVVRCKAEVPTLQVVAELLVLDGM